MSAPTVTEAAKRVDRRSLRWKLPWFFALTAALTVAAFGVLAYGSARSLALQAATTRLQSALSQIKTVAELGVANQLTSLREVARDPDVIAALRHQQPVSDSVVKALRRLKGVSDSTVVVELLDADGTLRHVLPESAGAPGDQRSVDAPLFASVGEMRQQDGVVSFASTIPVSSGANTIGWIRVIRRQGNGVNQRMAGHLLEGAVVLTGNRDGTLWSRTGVVRYQPGPARESQRYLRDGERWVSVSSPISSTPWLYAVEIPERVALAPANALVLPFLVTGLVIAIVGAWVGQRVSQRITAPLADLTSAAEALARGERNVSLSAVHRSDEIGRLARAFGSMAECVTTDRDRLEAEVTARTGELSTVAGRLRLLHDELQRSEKLATLGRLSGSVGHELRNPLGVMSNIAFLLDSLPGASAKLKEYAKVLREQVKVSDRIISDLLDRARSGAPVRSVVDVDHVVDEIVVRAELPPTIRVERQCASLPRLELDREHLTQILWNLVTNAVQAMDGEGVLTIAARYERQRLSIEVRDSGDGIAESDVDRIFEPLFTTKASGIGLGLSVSRAFARANGGDLFIRQVTDGACFVLELPAAVAMSGADQPEPNARPHPSGSTASRVRHDSPPTQLESV